MPAQVFILNPQLLLGDPKLFNCPLEIAQSWITASGARIRRRDSLLSEAFH
jgi:hypothetical protein